MLQIINSLNNFIEWIHKKVDRSGTRTHNLWISLKYHSYRSPAPYPLGHTAIGCQILTKEVYYFEGKGFFFATELSIRNPSAKFTLRTHGTQAL